MLYLDVEMIFHLEIGTEFIFLKTYVFLRVPHID
jgi:hypothetical protein